MSARPDLYGLPSRDLPDLEAHLPSLETLVEEDGGDPIRLLQRLQERFGFLPRNVLEHVSRLLSLPLGRLYGLATFYTSLFLEPRGRHVVRVCHGTACHVSGAHRISEALEQHLGVAAGETTEDLTFTLEEVACLGCCSLAPVLAVGEETHGRLDRRAAVAVVGRLAGEEDG